MFNRTSTKIILFIAAICTGLLLFVNFYVSWRAEREFRAFVQDVQRDYPEAPIWDRRKVAAIQLNEAVNNIVTQRLNRSINTVTFVAIGFSILLGFFAARFITRPLHRLNLGLRNLRQNNYKFKLKKIGTKEFDDVIMEFNKLVKQLDQTESLRKDLISDTSHELKTPITSLLGQLQGVKDGVLRMDESRVELLYNQVDRLNQLVEKLQEYSTVRSKGANLQPTDIGLNEVIKQIKETYKCAAEEQGISIESQVSDTPKVKADKYLLPRIIGNLVDNAIKYSKGNLIEIKLEDNQIIVGDDGIGIPDEHLPYIFERFYRVDQSRNRETGGMGLGLSIVKEMVEAHGWKIEVKNRKPRGLEFIISLNN
jgi:two-component system, OmpR family, sensor histidine kinase BaeS